MTIHQSSSGPDARDVACAGLTVLSLRAAEQDVVVVVGEADLATAGKLRADLLGAVDTARGPVVVELGSLTFCDVRGLRALQEAERAAQAAGVGLTFRGMSRQLSWLYDTFPLPCGEQARPPDDARARAGARRVVAGATC